MYKTMFAAVLVAALALVQAGCSTTPQTEEAADKLHNATQSTLAEMRSEDPDFGNFLEKAYAYAIYPTVGEGAFVFGAGGGRGEVYEQGRMIGYSRMTKATVGAQIGGKGYAQVVAFKDEEALKRFIAKEFAFNAEVSAVALKSGVAKQAKFQNGVAVFQYQKGGLMAAAALGGQQFTYQATR